MLRPERGRTQNLKQGKVGDMEQQDGSRKPEAAFEQCQLFSDACPPGLILRSYPEQVERVQPSQQFKGAKGRQKMTLFIIIITSNGDPAIFYMFIFATWEYP